MNTKIITQILLVIVLVVIAGLLLTVSNSIPKPADEVLPVDIGGSIGDGINFPDDGNSTGGNSTGGSTGGTGGNNSGSDDQVFCTMDAMMCPDGSYVGRVPPRCEFASCPGAGGSGTGSQTGHEGSIETKINDGASALGVRVVPLEVLEDSRCPADVVCIRAGTVRVRTTLQSGMGTAPQVFVLSQPVTTEAEIVTLTEVEPYPYSSRQLKPSDYTFTFTVKKR